MGTQGDDEPNLIEKSKNYGWPVIAYGEKYSGRPINGGITARAGFEQPVYYWDPGDRAVGCPVVWRRCFSGVARNLFVGALKN